LLSSFPRSFEHFKDYGKEDIVTLVEVQAALRTNELIELNNLNVDDSGEGLNVPIGRGESRENLQNKKVVSSRSTQVFQVSPNRPLQ
jgi:hypothetical protein